MRLFAEVDNTVDNYDRPFYFGGPFDRPWYHVFPTLSRSVRLGGLSETKAVDPTIKSRFESGAVLTRARFTTAKKAWELVYNLLTDNDKATLLRFEDALNIGAAPFKWLNPKDSITYECRLVAPITFKSEPRQPDLWEVQLRFVEA